MLSFLLLAQLMAESPHPSSMTPAVLTQVPSATQMTSFYPADAMRRRQAGRAVIRCKVPVSGLLADCEIVSATEPSFGAATLKLSEFFRVRPATRDGVPVEGVITIPIVWKLAGGPVPSAATAKPTCAGFATDQVNDCMQRELGEAEATLQRYRAAAQARVTEDAGSAATFGQVADTPAAFAKAEAAWKAYKEAECGAVFDNWSEGTISVSKETACEIELTKLHTHTLWQEWLTFLDSTPPVLPEPYSVAAASYW